MRILHVLDHSLPVQSGYAFRSAAILREQRRRGWETLQVTSPKHGVCANLTEVIDGMEYLRTTDPGSWWGSLPVLNQLRVIELLRRRLREVVAREKPDIIHAHSPCLNALAAFDLGRPVAYELRSSWEDAAVSTGTTTEGSARYRLSRALETHVLRRANAVTTICEGLRRDALDRGVSADRLAVIPNAVDAEFASTGTVDGRGFREQWGLGDCYLIGFLGSFFAWEGLSLLIEALPTILARRPDARVVLVGGGEQRMMLEGLVGRRGLQSQVVFAGQVPHAHVPYLYAAMDLLAYPRLSMRLTEMVTPLKPLEAMMFGKPLIASDVGGHRELVTDGDTGVLFRAGDPVALAEAAIRVMADPALTSRLCENGPRYVRQERTWPKVVAGYDSVYQKIVEKASV